MVRQVSDGILSSRSWLHTGLTNN